MKLAVYEQGGLQEDTIYYWRERFGDRCTVVTSGTAWVDFIPFTTNKARGLAEYQKILNIKPEECITFGDEYNDIDMLKSVPYGFAMAHAKPGVKEVAAYETDNIEKADQSKRKYRGGAEIMYSEEAVEVFLKDQSRLYDEPVAETPEEALEFLEDCMAVEVENIKEVRAYLDEAGADVSGMTDEDLEEACEVFTLPSGGYLIVEA